MSKTEPEWIKFLDPELHSVLYANINTGECVEQLPEHAALIQKEQDKTEWWALFDEEHKLPYYYNTETADIEWVKPEDACIISLQKIQNNKLGRRVSSVLLKSTSSLALKKSSNSLNSVIEKERNSSRTSIDKKKEKRKGEVPPSASSVSSLKIDKLDISHPTLDKETTQKMKQDFLNAVHEAEQKESKKLPQDLQQDISKFQIIGFAKKYFTEHRKGLFRRHVPVEEMLIYSSGTLSKPLMALSDPLKKEALKCFKLINKIISVKSDKDSRWLNCQSLIEKGIRNGGLRDEIFVQICKQVSQNPNKYLFLNLYKIISREMTVYGWRLLSILSSVFPPSKNLEVYLQNFVQQSFNHPDSEIDIIARHASKSLVKLCKVGPKGRTLTVPEIERAWDAPFHPALFGETLEVMMENQQGTEILPKILIFLVDSIFKLKGYKTEGIFRVPGDIEAVSELKCRIEKGAYDIKGIKDPHVPSSLLKLWLRELAEPLIPSDKYEMCIRIGKEESQHSTEENLTRAIQVIESCPEINRNVIYYVIKFLQEMAKPENEKRTKMTINNIALVFAPNFLRCPSDDPLVIFNNNKFEQRFLSILITGAATTADADQK